MILFANDWEDFPSAQPDWTTENVSFLQLAQIYRDMGVKNFYFHLALIDPSLKGVDPHSPNLTQSQVAAITMECKVNPWYFLREVLMIPQPGAEPSHFRANRGNICVAWCFYNHIDVFNVQPRQSGKSASTDGTFTQVLNVGGYNTKIVLVTKDHTLRVENVERLKSIQSLLPPYLNMYQKGVDTDNKYGITVKRLENKYLTGVSQGSEEASNKMGRGFASGIAHVDEPPFIKFVGTVVPALLASGTFARRSAAKAGGFWGNIFTTTAGNRDTASGAYCYDLIMRSMRWDERKLLDAKDNADANDIVVKGCYASPETKYMVNATFSHTQLGYSDQWMDETLRANAAFGLKADMDFFNVWIRGSGSAPFTAETAKIITDSKMNSVHIENKDNYILDWYITPEEVIKRRNDGRFMIIGSDLSDAIGRDNCTMLFTDSHSLETVAAGVFNKLNLASFSHFIANILERHSNSIWIPERKSSGQAIIDSVVRILRSRGIDPWRRIYSRIVDDNNEFEKEFQKVCEPMARRTEAFDDNNKGYMGYNTTGSGKFSRSTLYNDVLTTALAKAADTIRNATLIDEMVGLTVRNGRIDHGSGGHDDMVIAWMLTMWFLMYSKNHQFYGLHGAGSLVSNKAVNVAMANLSTADVYKREEQKLFREELDMLLIKLKDMESEILATRIENRIRTIESQLIEEYNDAVTIDSLIGDARKRQQKTAKINNGEPVSLTSMARGYFQQQRGMFY